MSALERFCFIVDWFDVHAQLTRKYQLFFYPCDNTMEMYDIKQRRTFLKRTNAPMNLEDLYIGASVNVFARQLTVRDYGDDFTINRLSRQMERVLVAVKPHAFERLGEILDDILAHQFTICQLKMVDMTTKHIGEVFGPEYEKLDNYSEFESSFEGKKLVVMELMRLGACAELKVVCGPDRVEQAKAEAPLSLHARYGKSGLFNAVFSSSSANNAKAEIAYFFGPTSPLKFRRLTRFHNCTLAIIKPHAVNSGLSGQIVSSIQKEGFEINDMELYHLEKANAEEFLEVYKGVVSEYHLMLDQLISGSCIAIEIVGPDSGIVSHFRELVGPADPALGRQIRPHTLRAKFGIDKVKNAIHCTDLPEDGSLEIQYFFRILA
ncbi:nucleoside diphosphate kinase [Polychytrium aggregatum]|uniref:nucleoside diphosphate kinase n=1 Tax=Polychytrium aggregatum TaxID=110093 RepID=UPI0022FE7423|nr:nucleoside diphosphate kinase [Polychytrium aggregatum]KAI9207907.1 nucleoside diphosphate kinase [Polychytrium aggregatum]